MDRIIKRKGISINIQSICTAAGISADWHFCGGHLSKDGKEFIMDFEHIPFGSITFSHPHSKAHTECLRQAFKGFVKFLPPNETGNVEKRSIQDYLNRKKNEDKLCASKY